MSDIVQRLRDSATQARALDRSELLNEAAEEIERLRISEAEREAVKKSERWARLEGYDADAATMRGLLERMK